MSRVHRLTVALPAFNEATALPKVVSAMVVQLEAAKLDAYEVLIIDDGSTDQTKEVTDDLCSRFTSVRCIRHTVNVGFAQVQRACYQKARYDWVFLFPADGELDPAVVLPFIASANQGNDLVLGVPAFDEESRKSRHWSIWYHKVVQSMFRHDLGDFGPCLLIRRELAMQSPNQSLTPVAMTEMVIYALRKRYRVSSVVVAKAERRHGKAKGRGLGTMAPKIGAELISLWVRSTLKRW